MRKRVYFRVRGLASVRDGSLVRLVSLGDTCAMVTTQDGRWFTVTAEQIIG